jgi:hypothetical protein
MSPAASISPHFELSAVPKFVAAHEMWPLFCSSDFTCKASSGGLSDEAQIPRRSLKKRTRNGTGRLPLNNKHVTFDDSSVDTPSNTGTRSFDYTGITFADARREEVEGCQSRSGDALHRELS